MNKNDIQNSSQTDWDRLDTMKDEDIDLSDIPEADDAFFKNARRFVPILQVAVDPDILSWFKARGDAYPVLINTVLRKYMELEKQLEEITA